MLKPFSVVQSFGKFNAGKVRRFLKDDASKICVCLKLRLGKIRGTPKHGALKMSRSLKFRESKIHVPFKSGLGKIRRAAKPAA